MFSPEQINYHNWELSSRIIAVQRQVEALMHNIQDKEVQEEVMYLQKRISELADDMWTNETLH